MIILLTVSPAPRTTLLYWITAAWELPFFRSSLRNLRSSSDGEPSAFTSASFSSFRTVRKFRSSGGHSFHTYRKIACKYKDSAFSQNGSLLCAFFGVVLAIRFVISLTISVSDRI